MGYLEDIASQKLAEVTREHEAAVAALEAEKTAKEVAAQAEARAQLISDRDTLQAKVNAMSEEIAATEPTEEATETPEEEATETPAEEGAEG